MRIRRAFTLIEVNLAILVMAGGVLGMVALYSLGLRENNQSVEDVASAGFADAMFAPLVATLSSRDLTWSDWCNAVPDAQGKICSGLAPAGGWAAYVRETDNGTDYLVESGCNGLADGVAGAITGLGSANVSASPPSIGNDYKYALVATRRGSTISLAFRVSRRLQTLMSQPIYYTEVHFQGVGQ